MSLLERAADIAGAVGEVFFPASCHICGAPLAHGERALCTACIAALPRTLYYRQDMNPMAQRFAGFFPFRRAAGHFFYSPNSSLAAVVQDFKYRRYPSLAIRLGEIMARDLYPTGFLSDVDAILPVPMFWLKQARRGYNQTHMLARGISQISGIPVDLSLVATRPHKTQTSLSHAARSANTIGIFRLKNPERLSGRHILLLDDVCTTGATMRSAALQIRASYRNPTDAPDISLLSLAVTQH